jgi:trypsin
MRLRTFVATAAAVAAIAGPFTPAKAIVGGAAAGTGDYPFMAAITDRDGFQYCGGSVISSLWILTAAHCVQGEQASRIRVVTGRTNLTAAGGQVLNVAEVWVHPKYDGNGWDAALLKLASATSSPAITLATAADDHLENPGTILRVTGWGDQTGTLGLTATSQMRWVDLQVVSDSNCGLTNFGLHAPTGVCAEALAKDSCQGDSGGPLFRNAAPRIQVGIVSYGTGCGLPKFPGVYSEVNNADIRGWITTTSGV